MKNRIDAKCSDKWELESLRDMCSMYVRQHSVQIMPAQYVFPSALPSLAWKSGRTWTGKGNLCGCSPFIRSGSSHRISAIRFDSALQSLEEKADSANEGTTQASGPRRRPRLNSVSEEGGPMPKRARYADADSAHSEPGTARRAHDASSTSTCSTATKNSAASVPAMR